MAELCATASETSRELRQLHAQILPPWEEWPLKERGTAIEWIQFLRALTAKDGLLPFSQEISMDRWQWSALTHTPGGQPIRIERSTGPCWRTELQEKPQESFHYQSGTYRSGNTLVWLRGQSDFDDLPFRAKLAYSQLVLHFIEENQDRYLNLKLTRVGGNYDHVDWTSPILAFLRQAKWIPIQVDGETSWAKPCDAWYAPRTEFLPPFITRIDRSLRELIDRSKSLSTFMASQLGLQMWSSPATSAGRIALLGHCLANGIGEAERDTFRKAYREAWENWEQLDADRPPLADGLIIPVEIGGRVSALPDDDQIVYVSDDSNPMRHQLVAALDAPVFSAPTGMAQTCADALATVRRGEFKLLTDAELQVEADGNVFLPSADAELLVASDREWLAEISALVLELRTNLTNRNTDRVRQGLYQSLKRVRIKFVETITVTLGAKRVALPSSLQHVLPVPHPEYPTLLVEGADTLSWPLLATMATGLALIIQQPTLAQHFKLAFLEIAQRELPGVFERPDDEIVAIAVDQSVQRIRELYRSLRSTSQHLIEFLVPALYLKFGSAVAVEFRERAVHLFDEAEVSRWIRGQTTITVDEAVALVNTCRDAEGLDDVRRALGFDLPEFNTALGALGAPWMPLRFEDRLRRSFKDRVEEKRTDIQRRVRDAFFQKFNNKEQLDSYVSDGALDWIIFPKEWIDLYADLTDDLIDQSVGEQFTQRYPDAADREAEPLETVRRRNRAELVRNAELYRRLIRAWCARDESRQVPQSWSGTAEQLARDAVASGYLDFRVLIGDDLISVLARAKLWPTDMPTSQSLSVLGLTAKDLRAEEQQEEKRQQAALKAKRSIAFGNVEVDGGEEGCFEKVAGALQTAFGSEGFRKRSGTANLEAFRSSTRSKGGGGGNRTRDPVYLSEEQRVLIGFAGELAAYHYLRQQISGFSDQSWLSSIGRRYLGLPPTGDTDGFDFSIPRSRGPLCYEVKSSLGDPGYVDLERSQVMAAVQMASERRGRWRILYVANLADPELVTVLELPNPYSERGKPLFHDERSQGVRLRIHRGD